MTKPTQAQIEAALGAYEKKLTEIFDQRQELTPQDREAAMTAALTAAAIDRINPTQAQFEAAAAQIRHELGCTITASQIAASRALTAAAEAGEQTASAIRAENERVIRMKAATIERCAQVADAKARELLDLPSSRTRLIFEVLREVANVIRGLKR